MKKLALTKTALKKAAPPAPAHSRTTRVFHGALALAIVVQLASAQFMQVPRVGRAANTAFEVHEWAGMVALVLTLVLWGVVMVRTVGTDAGALVPWFSVPRRAGLQADAVHHIRALRALRLPGHQDHSALASAVHGLGLLLMTGMAASGTVYFIAGLLGVQDQSAVHLMMDLHGLGGNLVWGYLIGHAGLALLHHLRSEQSLRTMWSLRKNPAKGS